MEHIEHIILVSLENRSFHYVLGFMEDHTGHYNYDKNGNKVYCSQTEPMTGGDGIEHDIAATRFSIRGLYSQPMTGFVYANQTGVHNTDSLSHTTYIADPTQIMGYTREGSIPVLHTLAKNFTVCDRWFASIPTETFPNRAYAISATSQGRISDDPRNILKFLYTSKTIFGDRFSWKIYYKEYSDDYFNVRMVTPCKAAHHYKIKELISHIRNGKLAQFSYVQLDTNESSIGPLVDFIGNDEMFVGEIYNTLYESEYWNKTLMIVTYDEHGGFYDPVIPPFTVPPDSESASYTSSTGERYVFNFGKLGVRIPTILVSPWSQKIKDSTVYDHTSVLAFLEHKFIVDPLTERDGSANYNFPFTSEIRTDVPGKFNIEYKPNPYSPPIYNRVFTVITAIITFFGKPFRCLM